MHKSFIPVMVTASLALGVLTHGCQDSSGGRVAVGATAAPAVTGVFSVIATSPSHGATDVPVDVPLYITFDADVDPASLVAGVTLDQDTGPVTVTVKTVTPRVVSVTPAANLAGITSHLLRIRTGVRDVNGAALAADVNVRFTTSATVPIVGPGTGVVPPATPGIYSAGVGTADMTPGAGVPLAGFGGGARRHMPLPDLNPFNDYTFLNPAIGVLDPVMAKALVLDNGTERVCIVTLDAIATEANVVEMAYRKAAARGFSVPLEKVLVCSSHTHSGPGAISRRLVWEVIAVDLYRRRVADRLTDKIADAMVAAEQSLQPAAIGIATTQVTGATTNRREAVSPDLDPGDVDPELIVIRVDKPDGTPIASVWNFGIHGTHFGTSNMSFSADIMGSASIKAKAQGAGECLFLNGAEGDIKPQGGYDATGQLLADAILTARRAAQTSPTGVLQSIHETVDMGQPTASFGLRHAGASVQSNWLVQGLGRLGISPQVNFAFPQGWIDREFRYQAIRIGDDVITSMPGEPIHRIGLALKQDGRAMGYRLVIPAGLANGHGSYFTTATEYGYGGYEGMASFFGAQGGADLQANCRRLMDLLKP